jgi:hypothetical protein
MRMEREKLDIEREKLQETKSKNREDARLKRMQINKQSKTSTK